MEEELKRENNEIGTQSTAIYDVYKTSTGLYLIKDLCETYHIGDLTEEKTIRDNVCYLVSDQELRMMEEQSRGESVRLIPNIVTIFDLQLVLSFTVYVDAKHDHKKYILSTLCEKYKIEASSKRTIKGATYCNVKEEDILRIEQETKNDKIILKRNEIEIELDDPMKAADYLFIYYYDYDTKTTYVGREMYELFKREGVTIEGNPKIINDKNCYSITEAELKEVEEKVGYRGIEQLLKPKKQIYIPHPVKQYPNEDSVNKVVETITAFKDNRQKQYQEERKQTRELMNQDILLIYQDQKTRKLYIPTRYFPRKDKEVTMITNKPCYEVKYGDLEDFKDYKIMIADVYTNQREEYNIIICNNNGHLFIAKEMLERLGFYIENPHRILVNQEVYEEITEDDVELIRSKDSENCMINIIVKTIAPKRG
ncbi:MAG: hypothetical protein J6X28_02890 [Bacilli bacterium]|nr:hypothetical protein [Bacilli bacterium]